MLPERSLIILLLWSTLNLPRQFWRHRSDKNADGFLNNCGPEIKSHRMGPVIKYKKKPSSGHFNGYKTPQNTTRCVGELGTCVTFQLKITINVIFYFLFAFKSNLCLSNYAGNVWVRSAAKLSDQFVLVGGSTASNWSGAQLTRIM